MAYGPVTTQILVKLDTIPDFDTFANFRPEEYSSPFSERLVDFLNSFLFLPDSPKKCRQELTALIQQGSLDHGFQFGKTTLHEWLSGGRDPGITGGEESTRANAYKLSAALGFDYEQTQELFEKVFFTTAFYPKYLEEFVYLYFAASDFRKEIEGSAWYDKATAFLESLDFQQDVSSGLRGTRQLLADIAGMDTSELKAYILKNAATFQKENRYQGAVEAIKYYAGECSTLLGLSSGDSGPEEIQYDSLITAITGYSQRGTNGASMPVSKMKELPPQLTANFPTGAILRKIVLGKEQSFDKIYKMLCLLLFYYFFRHDTALVKSKNDFRSFIRFANRSLDAAGMPGLYPRQPFGGFILHCAASQDPLEMIRLFLNRKAEECSAATLLPELKAAHPEASDATLMQVVRELHFAPWAVAIAAKEKAFDPEDFTDMFDGDEDLRTDGFSDIVEGLDLPDPYPDMSEQMQYLLDSASPDETDRAVLRLAALLPAKGIAQQTVKEILTEDEKKTFTRWTGNSWIQQNGERYLVHYQIRSLIMEQEWFPRWSNCGQYAERLFDRLKRFPEEAESDGIRLLMERFCTLDGISKTKRDELKKALYGTGNTAKK